MGEGAAFHLHTAVEISIQLLDAYMMRQPIKMQRHIGNGAPVIGQQAITQLLPVYLFQKKLIRIRKANYQQPRLIDNRVA